MKIGLPVLIIILMMVWLGGTFRRGMVHPGKVTAAQTSAAGTPLYTVTAVTAPLITEKVGAVQPQVRSTVSARVTASVIALPVVAGQHVRKGEVLVRLDDRDLQTMVRQASEELRQSEATRDLAQSDYERDKGLYEKAVIPKSDFDVTNMRLRTSTADVAAKQQALRDAQVYLTYTVVRSPYDGVIIDKLSDVGDMAAPGKPLLSMYESGRLWLEAAVPEEQSADLHIGKTYKVRLDAMDKAMEGRLVEVVPSADPSSRTITARVTIPYADNIFPGLFGRMYLPTGERLRTMVPNHAILRIGELAMVDVDEDGVLRRRSVQLGQQIGDQVEVLSGLVPGEKVSLSPRKKLDQ
ncbi:MAG: efflux RND transporter periplasmic adaptor subunit [Acidobacteriaceae bacterium]